jgi:peptide-N4-(N-acetyl-beta-glucosaminyl)asparagine amidase
MSWVNAPPCDICSNPETVGIGPGSPTPEETKYGGHRVELYRCECGFVTRFPRFNHLDKLMETRRGRCGEWANLFTLFSISMGFETRYGTFRDSDTFFPFRLMVLYYSIVLDFTDHVWIEFYSENLKRWGNYSYVPSK